MCGTFAMPARLRSSPALRLVLGELADDVRDVAAELALDAREIPAIAVLDDVVQQAGHDHVVFLPPAREDQRDVQRMDDIRLGRGLAQLAVVSRERDSEGLFDEGRVHVQIWTPRGLSASAPTTMDASATVIRIPPSPSGNQP